jgi:hypothetical protein
VSILARFSSADSSCRVPGAGLEVDAAVHHSDGRERFLFRIFGSGAFYLLVSSRQWKTGLLAMVVLRLLIELQRLVRDIDA